MDPRRRIPTRTRRGRSRTRCRLHDTLGELDEQAPSCQAGNLINALLHSDGEFLLILDADQVPEPEILDRTLGYFTDDSMALVQTPQYFTNVPDSDPPRQPGPAVLRSDPAGQGRLERSLLLRVQRDPATGRTHAARPHRLRPSRRGRCGTHPTHRRTGGRPGAAQGSRRSADVAAALDSVRRAVRTARGELRSGVALADVTFGFQQSVDAAARSIVDADFGGIRADLEEIAALEAHGTDALVIDDTVLERLADREWSPLGALESIRAMIRAVDVDARRRPNRCSRWRRSP